MLSPREHRALIDVYDAKLRRWAMERADFRNAHFVGQGQTPWIADDFLGLSDRGQRGMEQARSMMLAEQANIELMKMKKGEVPEGLPDWAK